MSSLKFKPEGWNNEISQIDISKIKNYIQNDEIMQGLVKKCDKEGEH